MQITALTILATGSKVVGEEEEEEGEND